MAVHVESGVVRTDARLRFRRTAVAVATIGWLGRRRHDRCPALLGASPQNCVGDDSVRGWTGFRGHAQAEDRAAAITPRESEIGTMGMLQVAGGALHDRGGRGEISCGSDRDRWRIRPVAATACD